MTVFLARTAVLTAAAGVVLLASLTGAGAASAGIQTDSPRGFDTPPASAAAVLQAPSLTVSHGRKLG
jgi:hypothetical protein